MRRRDPRELDASARRDRRRFFVRAARAPAPAALARGASSCSSSRRWMWSSRGLGHRQHPPSSVPRGLTTSSHPRRRFLSRAPAAAAGEGDAAPAPPGAGDAVDCVRITRLSGSDVGALSDVLLSLGATCCTVEDADLGTDDELELYAGDEKVWHRCDVTAMFAPGEDVDAIMADAQDILDSDIAYRRENIPGDDWVGVVLDSFEPVRVADGIWIVPEWTTQTEDPDAVNVVLEPGLAFGTGEHPTTRLCLAWLHARRDALPGTRVMDFGTGSGVLAIGALLMGAKAAVGVDMEEQSVQAAGRNAALNGVERRLDLYLADGSDDEALPPGRGEVDIMVANILVGPIVHLAPLFASYVKPGGEVCLSGVLVTQTPRVIEAYGAHFENLAYEEEEGWAVVTGVRNDVPA